MRRLAILLYLVALGCFGLLYAAMQPVFEGFDETAHYSSLRQIADTGTIPIYGKAVFPQDVAAYPGPLPYGSLAPPFDNGPVYTKFFDDAAAEADYRRHYRQPPPTPLRFLPSTVANWQAQHPPLYYLLLAPLLKATEALPLVTSVLILRLASYGLALGGVGMGLLGLLSYREGEATTAVPLGFLLYPLILPMFFPEFARIGNDSLCLFLAGAMALPLARLERHPDAAPSALMLGVLLGLGLLTKALFVPICAAIVLYLLIAAWRDRRPYGLRQGLARRLALVVLPALLLGGGWYLYKWIAFGDPIGGNDAITLNAHGGLLANLEAHFTVAALARGMAAVLATWSWAGTWSLTEPSLWLQLPLELLLAWTLLSVVMQWRSLPARHPAWLAAWMVGLSLLGLFDHILIEIAQIGSGGTPGWYLHILMPWMALLLGIGARPILAAGKRRWAYLLLLAYAAVFQGMMLWAQFALFTGCASKGADKHYQFAEPAFCLLQVTTLWDRLDVLAWPGLALFGLLAGSMAVLALGWSMRPQGRLPYGAEPATGR